MLPANIDDHARRTGKIAAVHHLAAIGTADIAYLSQHVGLGSPDADKSKNGGLFFAVGADAFECLAVRPETVTFFTFA